jgi:hypothetical protein
MKRSYTIHTADGHMITVQAVRPHVYDVRVRNDAGDTIATVTLTEDALSALIAGMEAVK